MNIAADQNPPTPVPPVPPRDTEAADIPTERPVDYDRAMRETAEKRVADEHPNYRLIREGTYGPKVVGDDMLIMVGAKESHLLFSPEARRFAVDARVLCGMAGDVGAESESGLLPLELDGQPFKGKGAPPAYGRQYRLRRAVMRGQNVQI